ncbi:MAG: molybdopterin-dependent oxidoreductase, partial [Planctomycetota bacterium]|nr:molybdopterin-dependent oxidoreductase [Planctomycetota bacterium]
MKFDFVLTTCPFCGCGCNFYLHVVDDRLVDVVPCRSHPVSEGALCILGRNAHRFVQHSDRLTGPQVRRDGELKPASWDDALGLVAERLRDIRDKHGPGSIGVLSSAKC